MISIPVFLIVLFLYLLSPAVEYCWGAVRRFVFMSLIIEIVSFVISVTTVCLLANCVSIMKWAYANLVISSLKLLWYLIIILAFLSPNNDCWKVTPTIYIALLILAFYGVIVIIGWFLEVTTLTCAHFCDRCLPKEFWLLGDKFRDDKWK